MENIARRKAEKANELNKNPSEEKAPEIKLKNSNTKKEQTEKQLDALAKGKQKRTQNSTIKNNKSNKENKENINKAEKEKKSLIKRIIKNNQILDKLDKQLEKLKYRKNGCRNIKKINIINNKIEDLMLKVKDADEDINMCKKQIENLELIINHKTNI